MEEKIFEIIVHSGNARSMLYEALEKTREGKSKEADQLLNEAKKEMTVAHNVQTNLVQAEINGDESVKVSLLLIHAQDQLMTTMSEETLIKQMIDMQKEINVLKG